LSYEFPYSYKKFSCKSSAKLSLLNILRIREGTHNLHQEEELGSNFNAIEE
jgi:hypothetical protein